MVIREMSRDECLRVLLGGVTDGSKAEVAHAGVQGQVALAAVRVIQFIEQAAGSKIIFKGGTGLSKGCASSLHVRQPICDTSIGRWKKYEPQLSPIRRDLGAINEGSRFHANHLRPLEDLWKTYSTANA